eukprot:4078304-Lingulodinium_polyedra.AAC.1
MHTDANQSDQSYESSQSNQSTKHIKAAGSIKPNSHVMPWPFHGQPVANFVPIHAWPSHGQSVANRG